MQPHPRRAGNASSLITRFDVKILKSKFRHYVAAERLDETITFYARLQSVECERRLSFPNVGIDVAVVGSFILLAGSDDALAQIRHVQAAFIVDSIDEFSRWLNAQGLEVSALHESHAGRNITVCHKDGFVAEYFEPRAD
jgi:hypothetical protein